MCGCQIFPAAVVAFALNYAAYFAEIFRAGIQSIDRGQYEGAKVLGGELQPDHYAASMPQMVRRVLPPHEQQTITLVKDTSLIYVLALNDLLRAAHGHRCSVTSPPRPSSWRRLSSCDDPGCSPGAFSVWRNVMPNDE